MQARVKDRDRLGQELLRTHLRLEHQKPELQRNSEILSTRTQHKGRAGGPRTGLGTRIASITLL